MLKLQYGQLAIAIDVRFLDYLVGNLLMLLGAELVLGHRCQTGHQVGMPDETILIEICKVIDRQP